MHDQSTNRRERLAEDAALRRDLERIQDDGDATDRDTRQWEITALQTQLAGVTAERDEARAERDTWQQEAGEACEREDEAETVAAHLRVDLVLMTAERDAYREDVAAGEVEMAALEQAREIALREWERERGVNAMHARHIARLEASLASRAGQAAGGDGPRHGDGDDEELSLVSVDPPLLALLLERAAQTETLRRKYQQQSMLLTDKRIKPAEKVLTAAVWDLAAPVGRDPGPAAPRKVYRAALAERTGMSAGTISRKLSDLDTMGLISLDHRQTAEDHTELWVGVGALPDKALTAAQVDALATQRRKDRARPRRCPACGGTHLRATAYACQDCGEHCTDDDALVAGETMIVTDSGSVVDTTTGEIIVPAPTRADSARGQSPAHSDASDASDTSDASGYPRAESAHPYGNVPRCADSACPPAPRTPPPLTPRDSGALAPRPLPLPLSASGDPPPAESARPPCAW